LLLLISLFKKQEIDMFLGIAWLFTSRTDIGFHGTPQCSHAASLREWGGKAQRMLNDVRLAERVEFRTEASNNSINQSIHQSINQTGGLAMNV
jgi:hypothetical protein